MTVLAGLPRVGYVRDQPHLHAVAPADRDGDGGLTACGLGPVVDSVPGRLGLKTPNGCPACIAEQRASGTA